MERELKGPALRSLSFSEGSIYLMRVPQPPHTEPSDEDQVFKCKSMGGLSHSNHNREETAEKMPWSHDCVLKGP